MQSNPAPPRNHQNVSHGGGDSGTRRKRKPEELELSSSSDSERDEKEITSIVTNQLSSSSMEHVVVTAAMISLADLLYSTPTKNADENRKVAFRRGAHLAVVLAMHRNNDSADFQWNGIRVLLNMSACQMEDFKKDIIAVDGLKNCLLAMKRHRGDPHLQAIGCKLIGNLWMRLDLQKIVVAEGGLKAVVNAMENHKLERQVQGTGCNALKLLLVGQKSTCVQAAVEAECIARIIAAMKNHPNDADIQLDGCLLLSCLSNAHDFYRSMVLEAEGLGPIGDAIRIHKTNAQVKQAAQKAFAAISA